MSRPEVRILESAEAVCAAAADEFVRTAATACEARGRFRVALAGGTTPCRLHRLLGDAPFRDKVDWPAGHFFFGDERAVHADHADSNYAMARDTLFRELEIPEGHVHRMQAERCDLDRAAADYEEQIADEFEVRVDATPPAFDLILLGMGADGHTASLFPDTPALAERKRWVVGNPVRKLGASRMTFTFPLINAARHVVFTVTGRGKVEALRAVLDQTRPATDRPPAASVAPTSASALFLLDADAAAGLPADFP